MEINCIRYIWNNSRKNAEELLTNSKNEQGNGAKYYKWMRPGTEKNDPKKENSKH